MRVPLACPCALVLAFVAAFQDDGVLRESHPDGSPRLEVEVKPGRGGAQVRHGKYRRFAPDGVVLAEGRYRDGSPHGKWTFRHPNGEDRARGYFDEGVATRSWILWRADGKRFAEGELEGDPPSGAWEVFDADGDPDLRHCGTYRSFEESWPTGVVRRHGLLLDGKPHGPWIGRWSDGALCEEGFFVRGERVGPWRFFHSDGTPDHELLGDGAPAPEWVAWPDPEREEVEPSGPPPADPEPGGTLEALAGAPAPEIERLIADLESPNPEVRRTALANAAAAGSRAAPYLIDALAARDLADAGDAEAAARVAAGLAAICRGRSFGWSPDPAAADANRVRVRRWHSLWSLTSHDDLVWSVAFAQPAAAEDAAVDLDALTSGVRASDGRAAPWAEDAPREIVAAIEDALDWLARHQDADGRWSSSAFSERCKSRGDEVCDGAGLDGHAVGVTGLALLAFLRAGHGLEHGAHRDAVVRGTGWLLRQQLSTGVYGERRSYEHVYSHCIATWALSEVLLLDGAERAPTLAPSVQRAVDAIEAMRNRGDVPGWRYEMRPELEADTSVTGWATHALLAARRAGAEVDPDALAAGLALVERFTGDNGRVGYDAPGSFSARTPENMERFPHADAGEPLTSIGVLVRLGVAAATGAAADGDALARHAQLLRQPPEWDPESGRDYYYWMWGAQAARALGGTTWTAWPDALRRELVHHQEQRGERKGSWPASSAWSYVGGRVYATAALAIALSSAALDPG
jgi:antitoxin component YwqK of YwqJK toxin-antitoxin module